MANDIHSEYDSLRQKLYKEAAAVEVYSPDKYRVPDEKPGEKKDTIAQLRRRPAVSADEPRLAFTLTERDDVLRWEPGYGLAEAGKRRMYHAGRPVSGHVIAPVNFTRLKRNQVGGFLEELDLKLTPFCDLRIPTNGIRGLKNGVWSTSPVKPAKDGHILLFVHGTFSNIQNYIDELKLTENGKRFLQKAEAHYTQVLGFDHSTLAMSPVLNALDLARAFSDSKAEIDVIAHSRGGLVTRWWLEIMNERKGGQTRAVLVGSPLDGTSLAAPDRIRSVLDLFTNVAHAVTTATDIGSGGFPFLTVVSGLLRVFSSITSLAAETPVIDAAFAMIPGLCAQSQITNNAELSRLNQSCSRNVKYFGVRSSFQTDRPAWKFWRYFVNVGARIKETGATLVFEDENDLVVNTASMAVLARGPDQLIPPSHILDFGVTDKIHHTVYFRQEETAQFLEKCFDVK